MKVGTGAIRVSSAILGALLPVIVAIGRPSHAAPTGITGVFVDVSRIVHNPHSNGDTWDLGWADDGSLYTFADDSRGFAEGKRGQNLNFDRLTGDSMEQLVGSSVNLMEEYGTSGQEIANGSNWKSTGFDCIDGVFYAFVANNWYGDHRAYGRGAVDPYLRQSALNLSLIKSSDRGKTWPRTAAENSAHPMWTSPKFSTAYFFKYGRNGGATMQDEQNRYVYALSNDGFWNDGENIYLARVSRSKIGRRQASDWQFYASGAWSPRVDAATPIAGFPNGQVKCTVGSPLWLAPVHRYVAVTWYNPEAADERLKWDYPSDRIFEFYQADHPWGPWSSVGQEKATEFIADRREKIHRWYGPSFSPAFVEAHADGSATAWMTFSGMTWEESPSSLYSFNACPVTFYTTPRPRRLQWINDSDASLIYSDGWRAEAHRGRGDYRDDLHVSATPGATVEFAFQGSGIEILAEKSGELGQVEVVIDGKSAGTVTEAQNPFPLLYQIPIYRNLALANGSHTVRLINRGSAGTHVTFDGYRVFGRDTDPTMSPPTSTASW